MLRPTLVLALAAVASLLPKTIAVGTPFGLAAGTTGGGDATPQTPSSKAELTSWLSDSIPRVILLTSIYDFTNDDGSKTSIACKPWSCSPSPQLAIDANSWCQNYEPNAAKTTATYKVAGTNPLKVGNNKTLLGKGNNAGIKGKGLKITNGNNIIIQNIKITDINAQFVWGGDAIQIDGGSNIWIDHNYFQNIARQMLVTGYGAVTKTTFSNNVFNGETAYSATCNGHHFWVALFTGAGDQLTVAQNYFYKTSGRGPHAGGTDGYYQDVHMYNNYFSSVAGHAMDPQVGSKILAEGNYFSSVTTPLLSDAGSAFAPTTSAQAASCSSVLGRNCVVNYLVSSGSLATGTNTDTLSGFKASTFKSTKPMSAAAAADYVQSNAGVGIIN